MSPTVALALILLVVGIDIGFLLLQQYDIAKGKYR